MASESQGTQGSVEGISELLRCYICMERLTDASICPHCSKLGCYACVKRWVTKNRSDCPHCRAPLMVKDLRKVPLFDELGKYLDSLKTSQRETAGESGKCESCPVHKRNTISVYCESCRKPICSDCALFGEEHQGHSFKPLDVMYKKRKEAFSAEMSKLKELMRELMGGLQQMEKRMEGVRASKQKVKRDIQHAMEKIYTRLDDHTQAKLQQLGECRHQLKSKVVEVGKTYHELEAKMNSGDGMSSLLNDRGELKVDLLDRLQKLRSCRTDPEELPDVGEFINEVVPSYDSSIFKIHPFRELQCKGEEIYSKPLHVYGLTWRLKVYPNGHKEDLGTYLAVFVELTDGFDRVTNYQYCIEMLHGSGRHPERSYKREYGSDFADGESWGYRKFYQLSKLLEDGFLRDNTLVLRFSIRAPTYYQKCQDLTSHIQRLEDRQSALQQRLQTAQQQLKGEQSRSVPSSRSHGSPGHSSRSQVDRQSAQLPRPRPHAQSQMHESHHQHSHSAPAPTPPLEHHHRERRKPEDSRRPYLGVSQQLLRSPSHHGHTPKRTSYFSQSRPGELQDERALPPRRSSHEESEYRQQHLAEQRRKSADPAVTRRLDQFSPPSHPRSKTRELSQSHQELRQSQDKLHYDPGCHEGHSSRHRPRYTQSQRRVRELFHHQMVPPAPRIRQPRFDDSGSDNEGCGSQPWEPSTQEEEGQELRSASSSSNLSTSTLTGMNGTHIGSQEQFGEDDNSDMIGFGALLLHEGLSSQAHYHLEQETSSPNLARQELHPSQSQGLSQPSPPRAKHGNLRMSLTNLSSLTSSTSNLSNSHSQLFSQSVAEFPHSAHHTYAGHHHREQRSRQAQFCSQGHLNRLSSDAHLTPGLKHSVTKALSHLREEVEERHRGESSRRQGGSPGQQRPRPVRSHTIGRNQSKPNPQTLERSPTSKPAGSGSGATSAAKETPSATQAGVALATGGKSSSSSSLSNLNLI